MKTARLIVFVALLYVVLLVSAISIARSATSPTPQQVASGVYKSQLPVAASVGVILRRVVCFKTSSYHMYRCRFFGFAKGRSQCRETYVHTKNGRIFHYWQDSWVCFSPPVKPVPVYPEGPRA